MAELLATLAFLSAVIMLISPLIKYVRWASGLTALLCLGSFILSPLDSIHQAGGMALIITSVFCLTVQYYIYTGLNMKYLNCLSGVVVLVTLLSMYPEDGLIETIHSYTVRDSLIGISESIIIGLFMSTFLVSSISGKKSALTIATACLIPIIYLRQSDYEINLIVISLTLCLFGWLSIFDDILSKKFSSGDGRTRALAISSFVGIIVIYITTYLSLSQVDRIGDGAGAIAVSMWLTTGITGFGLIGMLLPLLGFDQHARPESWGWRKGISFSPLIICLNTDLAIYVLIGITIAVIISISSPLVLENRIRKPVS